MGVVKHDYIGWMEDILASIALHCALTSLGAGAAPSSAPHPPSHSPRRRCCPGGSVRGCVLGAGGSAQVSSSLPPPPSPWPSSSLAPGRARRGSCPCVPPLSWRPRPGSLRSAPLSCGCSSGFGPAPWEGRVREAEALESPGGKERWAGVSAAVVSPVGTYRFIYV